MNACISISIVAIVIVIVHDGSVPANCLNDPIEELLRVKSVKA